jgi:hypothetical protein
VADCKDIDKALAALSAKIDAQNQQITDIKRKQEQCCKNNNQNNNQKDKSTDLSPIYQRLNKLEQYCESVEYLFAQLANIIKPIIAIFK